MHFFPNDQLILSIGGLHITWYALFLLCGMLSVYYFSQKTVQKWGYPKSVLEDALIPAIFWGLVGARTYYVIFQWSYYAAHPDQIIAIWNGGLAMHGAIIGGVLYGLYYCHKHGYPFLRLADAVVPNMLLGQAIGRWGNFMNQEAYGSIVPASFYNGWPAFIKDRMFIDGAYRMPTFLFESVLDLLGWLFITKIFRRYFYRKSGDCVWMYCIWYGATRLVLELQRTDALMIGPFRQAQLFSGLLVTVGVLGLLGLWNKLFKKAGLIKEKKPALLFDLDGTLIDSKPLIFETFRQVFAKKLPEHKLTEEELNSFFGPTLEETFIRYFPEDQVEEVIELYQTINAKDHDQFVKEVPGVKETIAELYEQGYPMAIVSNKRHKVVERGLEQAGIRKYFDVVIGKEDMDVPKPSADGLIKALDLLHADNSNVVYVGDNSSDMKAAANMAAYSIGFSPEAKQREALALDKPCLIIENFSDLSQVLRKDQEWNNKSIW